MKDLWKILTTDENDAKYTTSDYVIGFAIALAFIALVCIASMC
jgi:hypothetical protein